MPGARSIGEHKKWLKADFPMEPSFYGRARMMRARRAVIPLLTSTAAIAAFGFTANAQTQYPKPIDPPNPYRLVEGWPTLPQSMNEGRW